MVKYYDILSVKDKITFLKYFHLHTFTISVKCYPNVVIMKMEIKVFLKMLPPPPPHIVLLPC